MATLKVTGSLVLPSDCGQFCKLAAQQRERSFSVIISFRTALLSDFLVSYSCHTVPNTPTVYYPSSNVPTPRDNLPEVHFLISFPLSLLVCWKVTTHICTQKREVSRTLIGKIPAAYP